LVKKVTIPKQIRAGDLVQWRDGPTTDTFGEPIDSANWTVTYYLRTNVAAEGAIVTSTVYQDGWQFSIPAATTAGFDVGDWYFQSVADKSGSEKQTLLTGRFEVLASLSYSGSPLAFDGRSSAQKDLDSVESAIRSLLTNGVVQEYKIGNRTAKKYDLSELLVLKAALKAEVVREQAADKIANGLGNPRAVHVRFGA
tara:strand:+ start:7 stop:597 length:591 start_codon:yes stop_codon:yes gene_type:complete